MQFSWHFIFHMLVALHNQIPTYTSTHSDAVCLLRSSGKTQSNLFLHFQRLHIRFQPGFPRVLLVIYFPCEKIFRKRFLLRFLSLFFLSFSSVLFFFCLFVDTNPCCFLLVDAHLHFPYIKSRRKNWAIVNALLFASCSCRHRRSYAASQRLCIYKIDKIFSFRTYHFEQWIFACFSFIA